MIAASLQTVCDVEVILVLGDSAILIHLDQSCDIKWINTFKIYKCVSIVVGAEHFEQVVQAVTLSGIAAVQHCVALVLACVHYLFGWSHVEKSGKLIQFLQRSLFKKILAGLCQNIFRLLLSYFKFGWVLSLVKNKKALEFFSPWPSSRKCKKEVEHPLVHQLNSLELQMWAR